MATVVFFDSICDLQWWHCRLCCVCSDMLTTNTRSRTAPYSAVLSAAKWAKASISPMTLDGLCDKYFFTMRALSFNWRLSASLHG